MVREGSKGVMSIYVHYFISSSEMMNVVLLLKASNYIGILSFQ